MLWLADAAEAVKDAPLEIDDDERGSRKLIHSSHFRTLRVAEQRVFAEFVSSSQADETHLTDKQTGYCLPCSVFYFIDPDGGSCLGCG